MNNAMSISTWGPLGWDWLHNLAICFPTTPSENDMFFTLTKIYNFINKLPCAKCKKHSIHYIKTNPINLTSNKNFQYWVFNFHNSVNKKLNKKIYTILEYNIKYHKHL
jgi:FAD-linked sulfhydryl oxidase